MISFMLCSSTFASHFGHRLTHPGWICRRSTGASGSTADFTGSSKISCNSGYWARCNDYSILHPTVEDEQGMLLRVAPCWRLSMGFLRWRNHWNNCSKSISVSRNLNNGKIFEERRNKNVYAFCGFAERVHNWALNLRILDYISDKDEILRLEHIVRSLLSQLQVHWIEEAKSISRCDREAKIEDHTEHLVRHVRMIASRSALLAGDHSIPTNRNMLLNVAVKED